MIVNPQQCAWRATCTSRPILSPVLVLRAPREYEPCPPVKASMSMGCCLQCSKEVTLDHLILGAGWEMIQAGMRKAGKVEFDRSRTTLEWQSVELMREFFDRSPFEGDA